MFLGKLRRRLAILVILSLSTVSLLAGCGTTAAPSAVESPQTRAAAQRGYILIGVVAPLTGPLSSGADTVVQWDAQQATAAMNKNGGIYIKSLKKKLPVKLKVMDSQSSSAKAAQIAQQLISKDKVDILLPMDTPVTTNPVSAIAERFKIPCVAMGTPPDVWLTNVPYKYSFDAFWTTNESVGLSINECAQFASQTNKVVGLLCPNDANGVPRAKLLNEELSSRGFTVVDPGRFPDSTNDFTSLITKFKQQHVQIVIGILPSTTFATVWRQMHESGFFPKIVYIGLGIMFPSDVQALGDDLANGLCTEVWWSPACPYKSSLSGQTCKQFADAWTKSTGKPWVQSLALEYAGYEIIYNALNRCQSLNPKSIVNALIQTNMSTIYGPIKYNDQHYAAMPLVGGQWTKGSKYPWELTIVYNKQHPEIPTTGKMLFPIPYSR